MVGHVSTLADRLEELRTARLAVAESVRKLKVKMGRTSMDLPQGVVLVDERSLQDLITIAREVIE